MPHLRLDLTIPGKCAVTAVAAQCVEEVRCEQPEGPYVLGGYSFGGLVAYEMAQQLIAAGQDIPAVILIDTSTLAGRKEPIRPGLLAVPDVLLRTQVVATKLSRTWKMQVGYLPDSVGIFLGRLVSRKGKKSSPASLRDYVRWIWMDISAQFDLIQAGLYTPTIGERRLALVEETLVHRSADGMDHARQACRTYEIKPIDTRVIVLRASYDIWQRARRDETLGWGEFALRGVDVDVVPGSHIVMIRPPYVRELGRILQVHLDRLESEMRKKSVL